MLRPRIIPCLLVRDKGLVKTVNFKDPRYVGDPVNAVRIFNEKEVDELVVLDISATTGNREPDYNMIRNLAAECRMPLCYGGGVKNARQAQKIFELGVEKVAFSSAVIDDPGIVAETAAIVGNQSVVVVLDIKKNRTGKYEIWTKNASVNTGIDPVEFSRLLQELGVGEITVNSIDKDGSMKGYDLELADMIRDAVDVPLTILGGAGTLKDIGKLINRYGIIGAAAGSLFVFKGVYRAVLINYPTVYEKESLIREYMQI